MVDDVELDRPRQPNGLVEPGFEWARVVGRRLRVPCPPGHGTASEIGPDDKGSRADRDVALGLRSACEAIFCRRARFRH